MGSLQVRCALACDVVRRAAELVEMAESAASIHAVCLARASDVPDDRLGARIEVIEAALRAQRDAVESACADLANAVRTVPGWHPAEAGGLAAGGLSAGTGLSAPDGSSAEDDLLEHAIVSLTERVAREVVVLLAYARDADAAIDEVLSAELEAERRRWVGLSGVDLGGVDLGGVDLSGVDLSGVDLAGAGRAGADLTGPVAGSTTAPAAGHVAIAAPVVAPGPATRAAAR